MTEKDVIMDVKVRRTKGRRKRKGDLDVAKAKEADPVTPKVAPKVEPKVEPKAESKVAAKAETKVELAPAKSTLRRKKPVTRKAFQRKKIYMVIDNTRKTMRRRQSILETIDAMEDKQARAKAVAANLIRPERAAKVPTALVKTLLKGIRDLKE
jgi:hypothetical protein